MDRLRLLARRTFLDGEGEYRVPGAVALSAALLVVIFVLALVGDVPLVVSLAFVAALAYAAGERRRSAPASEVEPVAPPYIPGNEE